jgi:DNA polymerase-3 subunit epsilon
MMAALRLNVEMIPTSNWSINVRAVVAQDVWDTLRYHFKATADMPAFMRTISHPRPRFEDQPTCRICEASPRTLELHEVWTFNDTDHVQRLSDLVPVCEKCHNTIHFGRASQLGLAEKSFLHLCEVNKITPVKGKKHIADAYKTWGKRCSETYTVDFGFLTNILPSGWIHLEWLTKPKFWSGDRLQAIAWARDRLIAEDTVILDTETTGLISGPNKRARAEVIELAIISMKGKLLYQSRFRPKYKVPKETTKIHGITDQDLKDCPTFAEEYPRFMAVLAGKTVLSYNDRFDSGVMAKTSAMNKLPPPDCQWECVMRMYRAFLKAPRFVKLPGGKHTAVDDCKATLKLVRAMARG